MDRSAQPHVWRIEWTVRQAMIHTECAERTKGRRRGGGGDASGGGQVRSVPLPPSLLPNFPTHRWEQHSLARSTLLGVGDGARVTALADGRAPFLDLPVFPSGEKPNAAFLGVDAVSP